MTSQIVRKWFIFWNRKSHIYIGLFLLLFIWLFSISGLILNHPRWEFTQFFQHRELSSREQVIQKPSEAGDVAVAQDLMGQLGIEGEIYQITSNAEKDLFNFRIMKPRTRYVVKTDFATQRADVQQIRVNVWGVLYGLHIITGVRMNNPKEQRDWIWTGIWGISMDAVSVGLIILALSGIYMWYRLKSGRRWGLISLSLGILSCGFFVFVLGSLS